MSSALASKRSEVAPYLSIPVEQLEAEGGGLGVDAVGTADGRCVLEFQGALTEDAGERENSFPDDSRGLFDLQCLGRVDHVVGSKAVVQPTGFRSDLLRHGSGERNDVVLDLGLDLLNSGDVDVSAGADGLRGRVRYDSGVCQDFGGRGFHLQPHAIFIFLTPDPAHGRPGITSNQPKPPG